MTSINKCQPNFKHDKLSFWVDEAIWGHRLYDEQTPWFIFLEFLNVLVSEKSQERTFQETSGFNNLVYSTAKRLYLRNILFNFPVARLETIIKNSSDNEQRWKIWQDEIKDTQKGITAPSFSYLQKHFEEFAGFVEIVKQVRSTCLEITSNKRWTSKFVFPYSPKALYEDLDNGAKTNDRRFFGRTGELLYLMLSRSDNKAKLLELLSDRLLNKNDDWAKLIQCLQPTEELEYRKVEGGFLPYEKHPLFDQISNDLISILKLQMPIYDLIPHLVRLIGLHFILYQQHCARLILNKTKPSYIIAEMVAAKRNIIRTLSVETYQENNTISLSAVVQYVSSIETSQDWQDCIKQQSCFQEAKELLQERFKWPKKDTDYDGIEDPIKMLETLKEKVKTRHKQHVGNIHRVYGKEIGLVSKRGTNKLRYAPTDQLLLTLVLTNVKKRMELNQFLNIIFDKYSIVISDKEAEQMHDIDKSDLDKKSFQANKERLEHRLSNIALLKRLSDGCAYVINPYHGDSNE